MKNQESIMEMFNLPKYIKGKTFAEASKAIADRYEGMDDKDSIAELQELQGRLQQAQEHVKAQSQPKPQPGQNVQPNVQAPQNAQSMGGKMEKSNDYFLGGIMNMLGGAGGAAGATAAGAAGAGGGAAGALGGAGDIAGLLGQVGGVVNSFKGADVDTSGKAGYMDAKGTGQAGMIGGGVKAATGAGKLLTGDFVGGAMDLVGGIGGMFGAGKTKKKMQEANQNATFSQDHQLRNKYQGGGFMDNIDPNALMSMLDGLNPQIPQMTGQTNYAEDIKGIDMGAARRNGRFKAMGVDDATLDAEEEASTLADLEAFTKDLPDPNQKYVDESARVAEQSSAEIDAANEFSVDDIKNDPLSALRYAPALTDAYQLATLKKPDDISRNRLGNKYQEQLVDEKQLVKQVQEGISGQRGAIAEASGGSQAAQRANLLGLSLQGTKALSDAMQKAGAENRQEKRTGQQFNLGVDQTNLQQSNMEKLRNEQEQGAYETQKSQLVSQLGANLGEIGKEQLFKKYPELMGMDFNSLGEYLKKKKKKK